MIRCCATHAGPELDVAEEHMLMDIDEVRVLVVDDVQDAADMLACALELDGYKVWTAHDGLEALAMIEQHNPHCILLDIDRFKQVNDTYGHQAGDQLLRDISNLLRRTVRAYDILVRWGGEEFLLVLPGVDLDAARGLADRVRAAVAAMDTHGIGPVTISAGAARFDNDYDFAITLRTADQRLYQAKAAGRNRVV